MKKQGSKEIHNRHHWKPFWIQWLSLTLASNALAITKTSQLIREKSGKCLSKWFIVLPSESTSNADWWKSAQEQAPFVYPSHFHVTIAVYVFGCKKATVARKDKINLQGRKQLYIFTHFETVFCYVKPFLQTLTG